MWYMSLNLLLWICLNSTHCLLVEVHERMADPAATGRRHYHSNKTPVPPSVPSHHPHLSRAAALQDEPQHTTPGRAGRGIGQSILY